MSNLPETYYIHFEYGRLNVKLKSKVSKEDVSNSIRDLIRSFQYHFNELDMTVEEFYESYVDENDTNKPVFCAILEHEVKFDDTEFPLRVSREYNDHQIIVKVISFEAMQYKEAIPKIACIIDVNIYTPFTDKFYDKFYE